MFGGPGGGPSSFAPGSPTSRKNCSNPAGALITSTRAGAVTLGLGWCADVSRPVPAGQAVTAWTDADALGSRRYYAPVDMSGMP